MDESNLEAWERAALDGGNARFLSKPDDKHEFDFIPEFASIQIRGNWISLHCNSNGDDERIPQNYKSAYFLIHSERNRLRAICDLVMRQWLAELPLVVQCLTELEAGVADEDLEWEAESLGLDIMPDAYRVGILSGGSTPHFVAKDLILDLLLFICECSARAQGFQKQLGFDPACLIEPLQKLRNALPRDRHENAAESK